MTATDLDDDVVSEIHNARIGRVDAVDGPAHGRPFLILKAAVPDPLVTLRRVLKAKYDADAQRRMLAEGHAMKGPDGQPSYPIGDDEDLKAAIRAVGRGGADHDKIRRYIARRARALGAAGSIPESWQADGSIKKAESMEPTEVDDLTNDDGLIEDGDVIEDAGGVTAPTHAGDPDDPSGAAWEAVDAAMAREAVQRLVWLQDLVEGLKEREGAEVAAGDTDDIRDVQDLECVLDALACARRALSDIATGEQAEADRRARDTEDHARALGLIKSIVDATESVTKAGRVLSTANEARLRAAHAALTEVLGQTPQPEPVEGEALMKAENTEAPEAPADVAKAETSVPREEALAAAPDILPNAKPEPEPAENGETLTKADTSPDGQVLAMMQKLARTLTDNPAAAAFLAVLRATSGGAGGETATEEAAETAAEEAAETAAEEAAESTDGVQGADAGPAPVVPALGVTPPPAATGGVLEPVAPEPDERPGAPVAKSTIPTDFEAAIMRALATQREEITKGFAPLVDHAKALEERLVKVEAQPATGSTGPLLNGAEPAGSTLPADGGIAQLRKSIDEITDPAARKAAQGAAAEAVIKGMMHGLIRP